LRDPGNSEPTTLEARGVTLDLRGRFAILDNHRVDLSSREFMLAETLFRHPGQVLTRAQLLSHVWGYDYDPGSNIVDVYVGYLRRKLRTDLIETVRGSGYRLTV
jgi:DNA-binding response OmpR family regulator